MNFAELEKTDVTHHIERKGQFSYLSWPYAVSEFRKKCPNGYWRIGKGDDGAPYFKTESGAFVSVTVYPEPSTGHDGYGFEQVHPVLDHRNNTVAKPNAFQINTSIQRALVKAIAIATGIGLHIYAGEDLPPDENGDRGTGNRPPAKKPAAKKPAAKQQASNRQQSGGWKPFQLKNIDGMAESLNIDAQTLIAFKGWLAVRFDAKTFDDIPSTGKAGLVIGQFADLYDEFMTRNA